MIQLYQIGTTLASLGLIRQALEEEGERTALKTLDTLMVSIYTLIGLSQAAAKSVHEEKIIPKLQKAPIHAYFTERIQDLTKNKTISVHSAPHAIEQKGLQPCFIVPGIKNKIFVDPVVMDRLHVPPKFTRYQVQIALLLHEYGHLKLNHDKYYESFKKRVLPNILFSLGKHLLTRMAIKRIEENAHDMTDEEKSKFFNFVVLCAVSYTIVEILAVAYFKREPEYAADTEVKGAFKDAYEAYLKSMAKAEQAQTAHYDKLMRIFKTVLKHIKDISSQNPTFEQRLNKVAKSDTP